MTLTETEKSELKDAVEHLDISILPDSNSQEDTGVDEEIVGGVQEEPTEEQDDVSSDVSDNDESVEAGESSGEVPSEGEPEANEDTTDWKLIEDAVRAGMSLEDAVNWPGGEDDLRMQVNRHKLAQGQPNVTKDEETRAQEKPKDILDEFPELSADDYDPETVKAFNGIRDIIKKQQEEIEALKSGHDAVAKQYAANNEAEVTAWFDGRVASMDDDSKALLGNGNYHDLNPNSKERSRRDAIATQIVVMRNGYRASNIEPPSRDELYDTAAAIVLANDLQDVSSKKLSEKLQKRSKAHIQRASGTKQARNLSATQAAAEKLREKFPGVDKEA